MPYYNFWKRRYYIRPYRRQRWRKTYRKRWFRPGLRRPRNTFRRRQRTRVRRKKLFTKRKKKALLLKQWQPELIRTCKIKGNFTLFSSNFDTLSNNYPQYRDSWVPQHFPSGGGWGIFVFNLGALFQEFLRVRNWWTYSNVNLPLVRYVKCKLTFYRDANADYVVYYTRNSPMTDNEYEHADACPNRMLMKHRKIIVTSLKRKHRKPYIRKTILPPKLLVNRWFFQRDMVNTNLFMLTATAVSLDHFDRPPYSLTNTIYLKTLNPKVFLSLNYHRTNTTEPYHPKPSYYLWATDKHLNNSVDDIFKDIKIQDLIFLGEAERLVTGEKITNSNRNTYATDKKYWGNIFHKHYLTGNYLILVSNVQPSNIVSATTNITQQIPKEKFTPMSEPILQTVAYNPEIDTGKDTEVYFLPNFSNNSDWSAPNNDQLRFSGFPLWMLLWGWADWQKKLALINQIDEHYILIVNSPYFNPNLKTFMFLDENFIENMPVYSDPHPDQIEEHPLLSDQLSWHPKFKYQKKSINLICSTCPGSYKFSVNESINAHMHYVFYFKWGGSPSTMETIANPEKQPKYTTPGNIPTGLQIQNPATDPASMLHNFDIRRYTLTQKATERLTKHPIIDDPLPIFTEPAFNPEPPPKTEKDILETIIQAQQSEKEAENKLQLLRKLKLQQQQLQLKLQHLILTSIK